MHVGWEEDRGRDASIQCRAHIGKTVAEIPRDIVDDLILTDDGSSDRTAELARSLGIHTLSPTIRTVDTERTRRLATLLRSPEGPISW
jgi:hypothetical protein